MDLCSLALSLFFSFTIRTYPIVQMLSVCFFYMMNGKLSSGLTRNDNRRIRSEASKTLPRHPSKIRKLNAPARNEAGRSGDAATPEHKRLMSVYRKTPGPILQPAE